MRWFLLISNCSYIKRVELNRVWKSRVLWLILGQNSQFLVLDTYDSAQHVILWAFQPVNIPLLHQNSKSFQTRPQQDFFRAFQPVNIPQLHQNSKCFQTYPQQEISDYREGGRVGVEEVEAIPVTDINMDFNTQLSPEVTNYTYFKFD